MRTRVLSLLLRPVSPPFASWIVVAVVWIAAQTRLSAVAVEREAVAA
jgi:hypothetical protein